MKDGIFDIKWFECDKYPANVDVTTDDIADEPKDDEDLEQQYYISDGDESGNDDDDDGDNDFDNFIYY